MAGYSCVVASMGDLKLETLLNMEMVIGVEGRFNKIYWLERGREGGTVLYCTVL